MTDTALSPTGRVYRLDDHQSETHMKWAANMDTDPPDSELVIESFDDRYFIGRVTGRRYSFHDAFQRRIALDAALYVEAAIRERSTAADLQASNPQDHGLRSFIPLAIGATNDATS